LDEHSQEEWKIFYMNPSTLWRNLSFRIKLGILMSGLALATVFLSTSISNQREKEYFHHTLVDQADLLLETISLSIRDPLYRLQLDELNEITASFRDDPGVTFFIIYDHEGRILSDSNETAITYSQDINPLGLKLVSLESGHVYMQWERNQLVSGRAVRIGDQTIGAVATGLSLQKLDEQISTATRQHIAVAFITVFFGSVLAFLLARQVTNPVKELGIVAAQMAEGDLTRRVQIDAKDEIGKLGEVFNLMASAIQQREQALRNLARNLEQEVEERTATLREQTKTLEHMAVTDPLTKILNRRRFFELADLELERATRFGHPLALVVIDADHFKNINDTFGHPIGDQVLVSLAQLCQRNIRNIDIFGRYGGEEFILLLPETECTEAFEIAERLRKIVATTVQEIEGNKISLTLSMGISYSDSVQKPSLSSLVSWADQALYQSKQSGRNMVTIWKQENDILA
jgi:diguanylate cyclase (GGDEF)-like protein